VKQVSFGSPLWLRSVNVLSVLFAAACALTMRSTEWLFPLFAGVWIASDFPHATIIDERGVCQRRIFGFRTLHVSWSGAWVEHERPAMGSVCGDIHVVGADGTTITFSGTPEENSRFLSEIHHPGVPGRIR
jgi:hypothetical protein